MNAFGLSGLLIAITSSAMAVSVFVKNHKTLANKLWIAFTISVAWWGFSGLKVSTIKDAESALFYWRVVHVGAIFIPVLFMHFVYVFLNKKERWPIYMVYSIAFFFLSISFSDMFIKSVGWVFNSFYYDGRPPTVLYSIFMAQWLMITIASHLILYKELRKSSGVTRVQIKYFLWGMFISFSGGGTNFLPVYNIDIYPYANLLGSFYPLIITYAILRYHLLDIHTVISKAVAYGSLSVMSAGVAGAVLISWERYLFGNIARELAVLNWFIIATAFFMTLIATLFYPTLIARMQRKFRDMFFKEKYSYVEIINELNNAIVNVLDLQSLLKVITEQLGNAFKVSKVSIIALDQRKNNYKIFYSNGLEQKLVDSFSIKPADDFITALKEIRQIIIKEETERMLEEPAYQNAVRKYKEVTSHKSPVTSRGEAAPRPDDVGATLGDQGGVGISDKEWKLLNYWFIVEKMKTISAEISIPLFLRDKLIGIISMDMKGSKDAYSDEDLAMLNTLSVQAAVAIENAQLVEMDKQLAQTVRHMDKLSSLGLLAAGAAHEIRNPLSTIKTFMQLFPQRLNDEEFKTNFRKLALEQVDRIAHLVDEILTTSRTKPSNFASGNINELIENVVAFMEMETHRKNIKVGKNLDTTIPNIMFDPEKMRQVLINFFVNAAEAMKDGGMLTISTQETSMKGKSYILIDITDTGVGISEENLTNLFTPFFTTKVVGTGLGLSISYQIIVDHHGMIDVKSQVNKGTTFYVYLPVEQPPPAHQEERPMPKLNGLGRALDNHIPNLSKI